MDDDTDDDGEGRAAIMQDEEVQESDLVFDTPSEAPEKEFVTIAKLRREVSELQELLKTEIVAHMKEMEMTSEQLNFTLQQLTETERRATEGESLARDLQEKVNHLLTNLEERDQSLSLLTGLYNEQLKKAAEAQAYLDAEDKARATIDSILKKAEQGEQTPKLDATKRSISSETLKAPKKHRDPEQKEAKTQRRKSYVRKTKSRAEEPKLVHLDELEEELGLKKPEPPKEKKEKGEKGEKGEKSKKRKDSERGPDSPSTPTAAAPIKEEQPSTPKAVVVIPVAGPRGYTPFITPERAGLINHNAVELWAHQPEVKPLLDRISETERARQEVIHELMVTEELYIANLEVVVRVFMVPLYDQVNSTYFTMTHYHLIFRNLLEIARANIALFKNLKERRTEDGPVVSGVGDIILKHAVALGVYSEYCGEQKRSTPELRRLLAENPAVKQIFENAKANPACRKLDMFAFLLLPMQRLTKYPLLLRNLLAMTRESDADYEYTRAAVTELGRLIDAVNQYAQRREELHRISELESQLNWSIVASSYSVADSDDTGRYLVQEGELTRLRLKTHTLTAEKKPARKLERLYCFFFNDIFLFTKQVVLPGSAEGEAESTKYVVQVEPLIAGEYSVRNVPEATNGIGAKNVFLISSKATGTIVLQASSAEEKERWISNFRKEDLIVESLLSFEEQGMVRLKEAEPSSRHSFGDLVFFFFLRTPALPPSPPFSFLPSHLLLLLLLLRPSCQRRTNQPRPFVTAPRSECPPRLVSTRATPTP